ncbi:MAG: class I SAM-dependent methyltransferase [Candidatus Nanoarchaeia archaeon]|nr:class I SAM-dependent methyltransferase [Candidatus Nanoarchaeia archaeon]
MKEGFGMDYERYALIKLAERLVKKYKIKNVLEVYAYNEKSMPSLASIGFAIAGCDVTLIGASEKAKRFWDELNLKVNFLDKELKDIKDASYDLVWNFASLLTKENKEEIIKEMKRISKNKVLIVGVNGYNVGAPIHKLLHKLKKVPWTHGDKKFMYYWHARKLMKNEGMNKIDVGFVDCPPWPDTVGFRDMRLHKIKIDWDKVDWKVSTVDYIKNGYPLWIKLVYVLERIPMLFHIKMLYSHLFYCVF